MSRKGLLLGCSDPWADVCIITGLSGGVGGVEEGSEEGGRLVSLQNGNEVGEAGAESQEGTQGKDILG